MTTMRWWMGLAPSVGLGEEEPVMLREFQCNITVDTQTGGTCAYLLELQDGAEWSWVGDREFGPFDTALDITRWLTKLLVNRRAVHLR